MQSSVVWLKGT